MVLSPTQEAAFDAPTHINALVYLHVPTLVFEAPLSAAVTRERATVGLTVGTPTLGALSAVKAEMTVQIDVDGNADGGRQRVRSVSGSTILVGRSGAGRTDGRLDTTRGGTVRVYADYHPYLKAPFISPDGLEQYKDETLYPSDNAAQPPVACAGADRFIITDASAVTLSLTALDADFPSYAVRAGASLASYAWSLGDCTVVSGSATSANVTVSVPRGARWVSLTVTDSNGVSSTTHRLIVVARVEDCTPARLDTLTLTPDGAALSLTVDAAHLPEDVPTGAKVLVAEIENYGTPLIGYAERFSGWLTTERATLQSARARRTALQLSVSSLADFLRQMPLFPQSVNIADGLGGWYAMPDANIDRLMHYALQWHTNALALADFRWSGQGATYPFAAWTTAGASVWADVAALCEAVGHELTADSRGRVRVRGNPHVLPDADQAATYSLPTQRPTGVVTTLGDSRMSRYTLTGVERPSAYWMKAIAILASTSTTAVVSCLAPSNAPASGTGDVTRSNWLVTTQDELNVWAANDWAATHAPPVGDLQLSLANGAHIVEPAERRFVAVELPEALAARYNLTEANNRWTVERVTYSYERGVKRADYTLKKEAVAAAPALTTRQTEADETVQAWAGFDTSIVPTTGAITQAFEGQMSLTQPQLEETLAKLTLRAVLSTRTAAEDVDLLEGGTGETGGGGTDTTANAKSNGGYYEVAVRLSQFWTNAAAFWLDVEGEADAQDRFSAYVQSTLTGATEAASDAWALYIATVSDTFPTLNVTAREAATEDMYCTGGARSGLSQYAAGALTGTAWTRFTEALKAVPDAQLDAWYAVGTTKPLDFYRAYYCALGDTDTFTLPASLLTEAGLAVEGNTTQIWTSRTDGSNLQIRVSGRYEDDVRIVDAFYITVKATGVRTQALMQIGGFNRVDDIGAAFTYTAPAYRADGIYSLTATAPASLAQAQIGYFANNGGRAVTGTPVGQFDITITDLGAR
jgi:hypothetical protein